MKKKISFLFFILFFLTIINVHADKEYKFTINNTLENKEIVYTWENIIDDFNFEMVSPSKVRYSLANYDKIEYDGEKSKISIKFPELEQGTWKVFFRGTKNPIGLKNKIQDYIPDDNEIDKIVESEEPKTSTSDSDIVIIGGTTDVQKDDEIVDEKIQEVVDEDSSKETDNKSLVLKDKEQQETEETTETTEDIQEEVNLSDEELLKRKNDLKEERDAARKIQKETFDNIESLKKEAEEQKNKKEENFINEEYSEDEVLSQISESEDGEILLNFDDIEDVQTSEKNTEGQQVIFMGEENLSEITLGDDALVNGTDELNIININADAERAKEQERLEKIAANKTRNNFLMVLPLIVTVVLAFLDFIFELKRKMSRGMVDYNLKDFDNYVDRSEETSYRQTFEEIDDFETKSSKKKGSGIFGKRKNNIENDFVEDDLDVNSKMEFLQKGFDNSLDGITKEINDEVNTKGIDFSEEKIVMKKKKKISFGFNSEEIIENDENENVKEYENQNEISLNNFDEVDENEDDYSQYRPPVFKENNLNMESKQEIINDKNVLPIIEEQPIKKSKSKKNLFNNDNDISFKKPKVSDEEDFNWD